MESGRRVACSSFRVSGTCTELACRISRVLARFAWPALWTNGVVEAELLYRSHHPVISAVGLSSREAHPHSVQFLRGQRRVDTSRSVRWPFHPAKNTDWSLVVRFNHDSLECLEVGVLREHLHPAYRSVKDVINKPRGATLAVLGITPTDSRSAARRQY
jgi:hypothetical protein